MTPPVLLAVAHGSRDPAAQECVHALLARVRGLDPGPDVRAAFLENAEPALPGALSRAVAGAGPAGVTVVPLLLATGYHVSQDIGRAAAAAGVQASAPLGPDPALVPVLAQRLAAAGVPAGTPVVLAAAGSRDPRSARDTERQAGLLARELAVPVRAAYLSAARPTVAEAVAALAGQPVRAASPAAGPADRAASPAAGPSVRPVAVATFLLAPGLFYDQLGASGAAWVSGPLGPHPAVARLVLDRFRAARARAAASA
ncbi:MAG: sirohydrochlorin chelatase [Gemmatimonadota bacterium]